MDSYLCQVDNLEKESTVFSARRHTALLFLLSVGTAWSSCSPQRLYFGAFGLPSTRHVPPGLPERYFSRWRNRCADFRFEPCREEPLAAIPLASGLRLRTPARGRPT